MLLPPRQMRFFSLSLLTILIFAAFAASAEDQPDTKSQNKIQWQDGPTVGKLGTLGEIKVPAGYRFSGIEGTRKFLEVTHNPPSGAELGVLVPVLEENENNDNFWFVIFEFHEIGYVKDDDKDKLNSDALLKSIQSSTEEGNKERARRGWTAYHVAGWYKPPYYDVSTKNLTWATRGYGDLPSKNDGAKKEDNVNYSVRILGRSGTMDADLVLGSDAVATALPRFNEVLKGFSFQPGHSYAEFRAGDKVAEYGLAALVAGGATALAAKTGLLAKLWKLIVALVVGLLAALKRLINYLKRVLSGKAADETTQQG
jgi:uncharacterized membrane-anchored protein